MVDLPVRSRLVSVQKLLEEILYAGFIVAVGSGVVGECLIVTNVLHLDLVSEEIAFVQEKNHRRSKEERIIANFFKQVQSFHLMVSDVIIKDQGGHFMN